MEKTIRFDEKLDSYKTFFDSEWARNLEQISQNTKLDKPAFELSASWKGVGNVRRMPWLMVKSIKDFGESLLQSKIPFPLEVMKGVVERVSSTSEDNYFRHVSSTQRRILVNIIDDVQEETMEKLKENPVTINKEEFWKGLLQSPEIPITLWMSEMTAYAGVYFAYEAFLIKSMKIALNLDSLRTTGRPERRLDCKLEEAFNEDMVQQCWADREIEKARLIRHAVTHTGCKMIRDLEKFRAELLLEGDDIIIMAHQTNDLYNLLKERVLLFSKEIVKLPSMAS